MTQYVTEFDRLEAELRERPHDARRIIARFCEIDLGDIVATMQRHPSLVAYAVASYEIARAELARLEASVKRMEAAMFKELERTEPGRAIGKIEKDVLVHPKVLGLTRRMEDKKDEVARYKALVRGLDERGDMLTNISARKRSEYDAHMRGV